MLASLTDLKRHLDIPSNDTAHDAELQLMLDAATEVVNNLTGITPAGDVDDRFPVTGGTVLLQERPAGTVTVTQDGLELSGFYVNSAARLLTEVPAVGYVQVAYDTATSGAVPASVTLATLIIAGHLWETQRGNGPGPLDLQGEVDPSQVFGSGFAVPSRARELLAAYIRSGQVA